MRKSYLIIAIICFLCSFSVGAEWVAPSNKNWHVKLDDAFKQAKSEDKMVLILNCGSDWNAQSKQLLKWMNGSSDLKKLIAEKNLSDTVIMTGFLNDVSGILNITDIQVNCSFGTEATSLSLLEGMSLGIPAVVSDFGGNPGVIKNGGNGFLYPAKDVKKMAECIEELVCDKELYEKMRNNCFDIYERNFTSEVYTKNIEDVYKSLKKS